MNETRKILLALLRCGLAADGGEAAAKLSPLFDGLTARPDWKAVYKLSAAQGVLAVAWDGLQRLIDEGVIPESLHPDRQLMLQWVYNVQVIEDTFRKQEHAVAKLAGFYALNGIDMMLLKGYGLSLCYPVPEHRPCGDIDIWLYGRQKEGDDLLRRKGVQIDEDKHHHTVFTINGVMVENHFDFLNVHSHIENREQELILRREVEAPSERVEVEGVSVNLPPANFNALFLLRHAAGHFAAEKIGLRHITDWGLFVVRYGSEIRWDWLETTAREYNMHRFLYCMNAIAVTVCGLEWSLFPKYERDELEERVFNDILSPEFSEARPLGFVKLNIYRIRRWLANRWKHELVYREGLVKTFIVQLYCHLLKPKSFTY